MEYNINPEVSLPRVSAVLILSLPSIIRCLCTGRITPDMVLSEEGPELRWQRQAIYALIGGVGTDHSPAKVLEGEREGS